MVGQGVPETTIKTSPSQSISEQGQPNAVALELRRHPCYSKQKQKSRFTEASGLKQHWATMISPCCCEDGQPRPVCSSSVWQSSAVWTWHRRGEGNTRGKHSSNYKQALSWVWNQKWQQQWAARRTHTHTHTHTNNVCMGQSHHMDKSKLLWLSNVWQMLTLCT